jgi:myo-inositol-1(or 4)-monophosphatase
MNRETEAQLESAEQAARLAGAVIRDAFGQDIRFELKGPTDPVTEVDRRCERMIRDALFARHPDINFWGEESGQGQASGPRFWLVDPLDGTKNFVHGYPFVAVSVALIENDAVKIGVVYDPLRDELFHAVRGSGAFLAGQPIEVSLRRRLDEALVVTGFGTVPSRQKELVWKACQHCRGLRRGGASALDLCQLAAGRLDAMWEWQLQPWDVAAGALIIEEAKGTVTRVNGSPWDLHSRELLATNTTLHRAFVDLLATTCDQ